MIVHTNRHLSWKKNTLIRRFTFRVRVRCRILVVAREDAHGQTTRLVTRADERPTTCAAHRACTARTVEQQICDHLRLILSLRARHTSWGERNDERHRGVRGGYLFWLRGVARCQEECRAMTRGGRYCYGLAWTDG